MIPPPVPPLTALIFSKDRALQLDATLRSFFLHCRDAALADVTVLYKADQPGLERQYACLAEACASWGIRFVRQVNFRQEVMRICRPVNAAGAETACILFLVDDNLFTRAFSLVQACQALAQQPRALGFSLRLGRNTTFCYTLNQAQTLPDFQSLPGKTLPGVVQYDWRQAEADFGYPLEVSSSLYRQADLWPVLRRLQYATPNDLELHLSWQRRYFLQRRPLLLCFEQAVTFCNPINKVQSGHANRAGTEVAHTPQELAAQFEAGRRIRVEAYDSFVAHACHQEVPLQLEPRVEPCGQTPLVSVLMPVYNGEAYLSAAVESILNQTFGDFEFLIVDDGSSDRTPDLLAEYAARDARLRLMRQANAGVRAALNLGLSQARGAYLARMDADDLSHPERLRIQVDYLQAHPEVALVGTNCWLIDAQGERLATRPYLPGGFYGVAALWELYWRNPIIHPSILARTRLLRTCGGYPDGHPHSEDYALWMQLGQLVPAGEPHQLAVLPEPLFSLRKHPASVTRLGQPDMVTETVHILLPVLSTLLGRTPPAGLVAILQGLRQGGRLSAGELTAALELLAEVHKVFLERQALSVGSAPLQTALIRASLARQLLRLAPTAASRGEALQTLNQARRYAPSVACGPAGLRCLAKILRAAR